MLKNRDNLDSWWVYHGRDWWIVFVIVNGVIFCHVDECKFCTSNNVVRELLALDIEVCVLWFMFLSFNLCFFDVSVTLCSFGSFVFGLLWVTLWSPTWDCWVAMWSVCSLYHENQGFIRGQQKETKKVSKKCLPQYVNLQYQLRHHMYTL